MSAIADVRLVFCFEKDGVLRNPNDDSTTIPDLSPGLYAHLKANGSISGGMIPKIDNAFAALQTGASEVFIKHALHLNKGGGTMLTYDRRC
jgi:acetylglutamate kinase